MIIDGKGKEADTTVVIDNDEPTEPIEIDVGVEEAAAGKGGDEPKQAKEGAEPKKGSGRLQRKIDHERALRGAAETTAQRLARENEELRQKLDETSAKAQTADRAALNNYEESVKANLTNAKRAMVDATNSGDAEKIAEATAEVSKWGAEAGKLENWRKANPEPEGDDEPEEPQPRRQQPQQPQQQLTPELKQFLEDNPWFVPGTKDRPNPEFDIEMHKFARAQGAILEQRYARQGKKLDQAYWDELTRMTKEEFGYDDDDGGEPEPAPRKQTPRMNGDHTITPAKSQQGPGTQQNGTGTRITLTPEQRSFARSMVDQGAYRKPDGKPLTYQEAEVRYAKALHKDRNDQAARGR